MNLKQTLDDGAMNDTRIHLKNKGHLNDATFINHDRLGTVCDVWNGFDSYHLWVISHGFSDQPLLGGHTQKLPKKGVRPACDVTMTPAKLAEKIVQFFPNKDITGKIKLCACYGSKDHQGDIFAQQVAREVGNKGFYNIFVGGLWLAVKRPKGGLTVYDNSGTGGMQRYNIGPQNVGNTKYIEESTTISAIHVRREYFSSAQGQNGVRVTKDNHRIFMMDPREKADFKIAKRLQKEQPQKNFQLAQQFNKWLPNMRPVTNNPKKFVYYPFNYFVK